ncbi:MAG: amino acid ABC transporter substrate-binding protein [Candidatus Krumholzibacteria bacterium]|nr:amino acid ABC transporter substrate-binding protein [Candidatus Krumholzibacteria bacterium]
MIRRTILFLLVPLLVSCAEAPPDLSVARTPDEICEDLEIEIRTSLFDEDYKEVRKSGLRYIEQCEGADNIDDVRLITGRACVETGHLTEARNILLPVTEVGVSSPGRGEAFLILAGIDRGRGLFYDAAVSLLEALSSGLGDASRMTARESLREVTSLMPEGRLERVRDEYGSFDGIGIVLEACLIFAVADSDTSKVRMLREHLSSIDEKRTVPDRAVSRNIISSVTESSEDSDLAGMRLGLLCPLSGRFSPLGEAFLWGASIAMKEGAKRGMGGVELVVGDTGANPLTALNVARRMVDEEKVSAIAGCVLSAPTIAASQVAQVEGVVMFSTVATETGISGIGDHIFQAGTDQHTEIAAIAWIACVEMELERIAFLSSEDPVSRKTERLFRENVERFGSSLVISDFYDEGSTDFLANIERIRGASPDALFIASDAEDLILILPQLSFYEFGVQLFGSSSWNSRNLIRMTARDMESAVFPAESDISGEEQILRSAAAMVDDQNGEVNRFSTGGYIGVSKMLEVMKDAMESGRDLRDEMEKNLENRQHRYIELVSGDGIVFYTIRNERLVRFTTLRLSH